MQNIQILFLPKNLTHIHSRCGRSMQFTIKQSLCGMVTHKGIIWGISLCSTAAAMGEGGTKLVNPTKPHSWEIVRGRGMFFPKHVTIFADCLLPYQFIAPAV